MAARLRAPSARRIAARASEAASRAPVPAIDGVTKLLAVGERAIAGGTSANRAYAETFTTWGDRIPPPQKWLVCDAMTSGGLLVALDEDRAAEVPGTVVGAWSPRGRDDHRALTSSAKRSAGRPPPTPAR
jgi:hypothetical protein